MAPALHLARSLLWQHAPGHLTNPLATGLMSVRDCQERRLQMKGLLAAALFATLLHFSHAGGINTSPAIQTSGPGLLDASVVTGVASRQCTFSAQWKYCLYKIPSSVCDELNPCNLLCTSLFYFLMPAPRGSITVEPASPSRRQAQQLLSWTMLSCSFVTTTTLVGSNRSDGSAKPNTGIVTW